MYDAFQRAAKWFVRPTRHESWHRVSDVLRKFSSFQQRTQGELQTRNTLVLFGAGHMGSAIARGMLRTGNTDFRIIDPNLSKLQQFRALGIHADAACTNLSSNDVLLLAMPPQAFGSFASDTPCVHHHRGLVISVMAGIQISSIQQLLGTEHVVRSIPNTPSEVFEGMTVYCRSSSVDESLAKEAREVLESFGRAVEVDDEALIDPATALCGGGPAFVSYFADFWRQSWHFQGDLACNHHSTSSRNCSAVSGHRKTCGATLPRGHDT